MRGAIINADSLQIYDALPLLTAQPRQEEKQAVPHLLYGMLPADQAFSAQQWRERAAREIHMAFDAGLTPVVVGGTGFYLKALIEGLSPIPDVSTDIRAQAVDLQRTLGNPLFHAELARQDRIMAARLHPNDTQRLIRAYEVFIGTGKSLAAWQALPPSGPLENWTFHVTVLTPDRGELHRRCDLRFDQMIAAGALTEVAALDAPAGAPITHALGYRPLRSYLDGQFGLDEAIARAKAETRQYAKRQDTWFRHQIRPGPSIAAIVRIA